MGDAQQSPAAQQLPAAAALQRSVQVVFFSSLMHEEGCPSLARIQLCDEPGNVARFADPAPLTTELLRRLSPAMSAPGLSLCVDSAMNVTGLSGGVPPRFSLFAERPGRVVVCYGGLVLAIFEAGEWIAVGRGVTQIQKDMFGALMHKSTRPLRKILMFSRRHRRGAMFVVCEERMPAEVLVSRPVVGVKQLPPPDVRPTPAQIEAWGNDVNSQIVNAHLHFRTYEERVSYRLNAIASAAGIDGATLLGPDYEPLGFGAKIRASAKNLEVVSWDWSLGRSVRVPIKSIGGMRHQSAVALVQHDAHMLVYVVSQDGTISAIGATAKSGIEGDVAVFRHLDRLLEADWAFRTPEA